MSEDCIIRNGAPTLAGLKTGNLFTCPCPSREALRNDLRQLNQKLTPKGLRILPLRFSAEKALIYLYRPAMLLSDLSQESAAALLRSRGYDTGSCERCVGRLAKKLRQQEDFPHEIGLFLGYPPEDVQGFIEQGPSHCKAYGCWRVYGDEEAARKKFAQYKHCTRCYREQWAKTRDFDRLTVAARGSADRHFPS